MKNCIEVFNQFICEADDLFTILSNSPIVNARRRSTVEMRHEISQMRINTDREYKICMMNDESLTKINYQFVISATNYLHCKISMINNNTNQVLVQLIGHVMQQLIANFILRVCK